MRKSLFAVWATKPLSHVALRLRSLTLSETGALETISVCVPLLSGCGSALGGCCRGCVLAVGTGAASEKPRRGAGAAGGNWLGGHPIEGNALGGDCEKRGVAVTAHDASAPRTIAQALNCAR